MPCTVPSICSEIFVGVLSDAEQKRTQTEFSHFCGGGSEYFFLETPLIRVEAYFRMCLISPGEILY